MADGGRDRAEPGEQARGSIPSFSTIEEEAEFWDTHDSTEFEDEFEAAPDVVFVMAGRKKGITVRFDQDTLAVLRRKAAEKGVGPSTLVRMWILERLRQSA